jgi:hypothetical protein
MSELLGSFCITCVLVLIKHLHYLIQYGVLAAAYRRYFGNRWYTNNTHINELGHLLCGFSAVDLKMISPETFKQINADIFSKINKCSVNQAQVRLRTKIEISLELRYMIRSIRVILYHVGD